MTNFQVNDPSYFLYSILIRCLGLILGSKLISDSIILAHQICINKTSCFFKNQLKSCKIKK